MDPSRSKSAPIETFEEEENDNNYIGSYNYYLYYNSIKPVDPRLPKPTYTPKPNLEFIRESKPKDEEDEENPETINQNNPIESVTKDLEKLNLDMNPKNNKKLKRYQKNNLIQRKCPKMMTRQKEKEILMRLLFQISQKRLKE